MQQQSFRDTQPTQPMQAFRWPTHHQFGLWPYFVYPVGPELALKGLRFLWPLYGRNLAQIPVLRVYHYVRAGRSQGRGVVLGQCSVLGPVLRGKGGFQKNTYTYCTVSERVQSYATKDFLLHGPGE